jgi:hypothetical protein
MWLYGLSLSTDMSQRCLADQLGVTDFGLDKGAGARTTNPGTSSTSGSANIKHMSNIAEGSRSGNVSTKWIEHEGDAQVPWLLGQQMHHALNQIDFVCPLCPLLQIKDRTRKPAG